MSYFFKKNKHVLEKTYDSSKWSKSAAWYDILKNRPYIVHEGQVLKPSDGDFRKNHSPTTWSWYAEYLRCDEPEKIIKPPEGYSSIILNNYSKGKVVSTKLGFKLVFWHHEDWNEDYAE